MTISVDVAVSALTQQPLADPSLHLKPKGREEVTAEIERWASRGLVAHVLVVDLGDRFADLWPVWDRLHLNPERDLLLIFNTRDWVARGWGLPESEIRSTLAAALPTERTVFSRELTTALDRLAKLTRERADRGETVAALEQVLGWVGGIGGAAVVGVVGLAIHRRRKIKAEGRLKLAQAESSAGQTYADVILACEDLSEGEEASRLQLRAAELKRRMDSVLEQGRSQPALGNDPVTIGRVQQLENELAALRSTVLQKMRGAR
jgi:hypothetical protein